MFGKTIRLDENEIQLDSVEAPVLLWRDTEEKQGTALSEISDKARKDKATALWKDKAGLDRRKTMINEDFWEDFVTLSKVCILRNPEADLYDVFETIRVKFLGGWGYTEAYCKQVDAEIAKDEARGR